MNKNAVIITGAGSGIGKACVKKFHDQGYFVFLLGRTQSKLEDVKKQFSDSMCIVCDLSDQNSIRQAVHTISTKLADQKLQLVGLINNAGIFSKSKFEETSLQDALTMFNNNLFGPMELTKKIIPILKTAHTDSSPFIVNVSSTLAHKSSAGTTLYSSSKAAMNNWTKGLALELAEHKIRVNCVCPGIVETPIHNYIDPSKKAETWKFMDTLQPLGRVGQPSDISESIYFLCSPQSSWTTGAILDIDGGISLK